MNETIKLKEAIMNSPWVWTACRQTDRPEALRILVRQMWTDAPNLFPGFDEVSFSYVNWIMLYSMLTRTQEQFYTLKEVASILRITRQTVYGYVRNGKLSGLRTRGKWLISQEALDKFMNDRGKGNG